MAVTLGVPTFEGGPSLGRRIAWLSAARLLLLIVLLALIALYFGRRQFNVDSFTMQVGMITLASAFALTAAYGMVLRTGRFVRQLADAQLLLDQVTWTVIVYLSGGASSGATSLYGLSCLAGAALSGLRGAAIAAMSGGALFVGIVTAIQTGFIRPPPDQPVYLYVMSSTELTYVVLVNVLILFVVMLLGGFLAERLRLTGGQLVEAEARVAQAERMAALGRLAAGLAHEIRNPLGSIAGSIRMVKLSEGLTDDERQLCAIVEREAARLNDLVSDMTDLARPRKPDIGVVDAARVARDVVQLATLSGRGAGDVEVRYAGADEALVHADGAQLRQLIWNLVRNAIQASSAGDAVDVRVQIDEGTVLLSVRDDGVGIDAQARERLFDAFFTTRSKGTGVGLAVVKRIADEHGFTIEVVSEAGKGAEFRVSFGAQVRAPGPAGQPPAER